MHYPLAQSHPAKNLKEYHSPKEVIQALNEIYEYSISLIDEAFQNLIQGDTISKQPHTACYPYLGIQVSAEQVKFLEAPLAYGLIDSPGFYGTTITKPKLFEDYLLEQLTLLHTHYNILFYVGLSDRLIPWHFSGIESPKIQLPSEQLKQFQLNFAHPNLTEIDDAIANHTHQNNNHTHHYPMALFGAERTDYSLHRLHHYTGTSPEHFQNFILLTNYQRYIDEFVSYAHEALKDDSDYMEFIEPGDISTHYENDHFDTQGEPLKFLPQMPAYHLKRPDHNGITFINIGIGPTNAKNITDHLAVLRPHCWLMLGHCAGLQRSQSLGDYVLAHGYVREDHVLDQDLPLWVPVPPIAEIQIALQDAVVAITGLKDHQLKTRMRTGTVLTTDNRNWELRSQELHERFNQSRAIALDMESATISANGLRFRVPYGTLLCVSDKPVHGEIKMRNMANSFYEMRVHQHLKIGLKTVDILRERGIQNLHSRKLRGFNDPIFR